MYRSNLSSRRCLVTLGFVVAGAMSIAPLQAQEMCGGAAYPFPYTDVSGVGAAFCPGIMEAYVTGVSKGTTPTTFSPNETVPRLQMTTFLQRSLDQGLTRTNRRAALNQWWTPQNLGLGGTTFLTGTPQFCAADGENIWVTDAAGNLNEIRASTGLMVKSITAFTGTSIPQAVLVARNYVFVTAQTSPAGVYLFFPEMDGFGFSGALAVVGDFPVGIAFDGTNIWTANKSGSVSIVALTGSVTTVSTGFESPDGILYDGAHIWVTDSGAGTLLQLNSSGAVIQTVPVGTLPEYPVFDGLNIWVPNFGSNSITVVQASSAGVVATISQDATNLLNGPSQASFDGERIMVTNQNGSTVTLFKAADLSFLANISTGAYTPLGVCSDGINFWIAAGGASNYLLRF